ncbi:MAG: hypothetical protein ACT4P7_21155 [Gemmatimonadaceae bacterium]
MRLFGFAGALAAVSLLAGCADSAGPTVPPSLAGQIDASQEESPGTQATVSILDECEPISFNAALGPGTCVGDGTVTFEAFLAELRQTRRVATWQNSPREVRMLAGQTLVGTNLGGEVHTFTEVAAFGGGIVPILNDLARTPIVAPECLALGQADFIPPGGTFSEVETDVGVEKYMCCIHPWMKAHLIIR